MFLFFKHIATCLTLLMTMESCQHLMKKHDVSTFAGTSKMGFHDGDRFDVEFSNPSGITLDNQGNILIADSHNNAIRKIDKSGNVSTLAGNGSVGSVDGKGAEASFFFPITLAVDQNGNIYVADTRNNLIRKVTANGEVKTIAGKGSEAFDNPEGIAVDKEGNIFVSDRNNQIYKIDQTGKITLHAGTGIAGSSDGHRLKASFYIPKGLAFDDEGNLFVSDSFNNSIRKITKDGVVTTLAGCHRKGKKDGNGDSACFFHPAGIAIDKNKNIFVADAGNQLIRKIDALAKVSTLAGTGERGWTDGDLLKATFWNPVGVVVDSEDRILVVDNLNNLVRLINE
jgi:DNA-binding beta-propeller fold protein YncE